VYLQESAHREKRQMFVAAIGIALAVMVLAPPIVEAATQNVRVVNEPTVALKNGKAVQSRQLGAMGAIPNQPGQFPTKAISVANTAGGGGFYGVGFCDASTTVAESGDTGGDNRVIVPAAAPGNPPNIVTGVIVGEQNPAAPPVNVTVKAPDLPTGATPITGFGNSAEQPTTVAAFGTGLTVSPSRLVFECGGNAGPPNGASFVVLGQ
jgi:hypothetical protein